MIYNVRADGYDPRILRPVTPFDIDLMDEPGFMLAPLSEFCAKGGPAALRIVRELLLAAPPEERSRMKVTVRGQSFRPGDKPRLSYPGWHTDYAPVRNVTDERRAAVHSYCLITGEPGTWFLEDSRVELGSEKNVGDRAAFQTLPWMITTFDGTEVHCAAEAQRYSERLFVRLTFNPYR